MQAAGKQARITIKTRNKNQESVKRKIGRRKEYRIQNLENSTNSDIRTGLHWRLVDFDLIVDVWQITDLHAPLQEKSLFPTLTRWPGPPALRLDRVPSILGSRH